ncbi:MAG TPA: polyprenol monophosphomannose synthase [Anaerolineales bacterium]|nr:polyprenol monophosphomannose synthase [Anaerolineales bacterium]
MQLTVVIPTYNEVENLGKLVSALFALPVPEISILVVDDNSPDGTGDLADSLAQAHSGHFSVLHRQGKLGFGSAYIEGFRAALDSGAEAIAQMDADFSHPPELLMTLLELLNCCDVVLGSRYVPGGAVDVAWPAWRKGLSAFGNLYARSILRLPVRDATGGFRLWHRRSLLNMPLERVRSNGYAFQIEMAYIASRLGYNFREVPFYFADRRWGQSKMSLRIQIEAAIRVWQMLFEYSDIHPISARP